MDLYLGPLDLEVTILQTEPQPLPKYFNSFETNLMHTLAAFELDSSK